MSNIRRVMMAARRGGDHYDGIIFGKSMDSFGRTIDSADRFITQNFPSLGGHTYRWFGLYVKGTPTLLNVKPYNNDFFRGGYSELVNATTSTEGYIVVSTGYPGGENGGLRATGLLSQIDDWWLIDDTTGEYLYKGKNVQL